MHKCRERGTFIRAAAGLAGWAVVWAAPSAALSAPPAPEALDQIVVTGRRIQLDEEVAMHVKAALRANPYLLDDHVTVTTHNGIVTLRGIALDYLDVTRMKRIAKRIPGVKRVVDDIDVRLGGE
jgi:hypothetical protein